MILLVFDKREEKRRIEGREEERTRYTGREEQRTDSGGDGKRKQTLAWGYAADFAALFPLVLTKEKT